MKTILTPISCKHTRIKIYAFLFCCLLVSSCALPSYFISNNDEPPVKFKTIHVNYEDALKMEAFDLDSTSAENEFKICSRKISIKEANLPKNVESIDTLEFKQLYGLLKPPTDPKQHYITCLKIFLGLDADYKLRLTYQPLLMYRTIPPGTDSIATYTIANNLSLENYIYNDNNKFVPVSKKDQVQLMDNYKKHIKIKNDVFFDANRRFNWTKDFNGDPEAIIFTFQEILHLVPNAVNGKIQIFNVAVERVNQSLNEKFIKHSLIMGVNYTITKKKHMLVTERKTLIVGLHASPENKNKLFGAAGVNFENLTHVCKPSCDNLSYKLANP
jgi:hypothetical protein